MEIQLTPWPNGLGFDAHDPRTGLSGEILDDPFLDEILVRIDFPIWGPVVRKYPREIRVLGQVVDLDLRPEEAFRSMVVGLSGIREPIDEGAA
jgi:hypothetical protein